MAGLLKDFGKTAPRSMPLDAWDKIARDLLEHIRKHGIPQDEKRQKTQEKQAPRRGERPGSEG